MRSFTRFASSHAFRACAGLTLAAAAVQASAFTLAPAPAEFYFGTPTGTSIFPPSLPQVFGGAGEYSRGSSTANLQLQPSPNLTLNLPGPDFLGAAIVYHYVIGGPFDASGTVAGTLTASMSVSGFGAVTVAAGISGTNIDVTPNNGVCFSTVGACPSGGYSDSLQNRTFAVNFRPSGQIELAAVGRVDLFGNASAMVDPVITLPAGYSLMLSPGAGNIAPVPEPATLLMLAAGLGLVGAKVRRRRTA